jgi:hypothetical protein
VQTGVNHDPEPKSESPDSAAINSASSYGMTNSRRVRFVEYACERNLSRVVPNPRQVRCVAARFAFTRQEGCLSITTRTRQSIRTSRMAVGPVALGSPGIDVEGVRSTRFERRLLWNTPPKESLSEVCVSSSETVPNERCLPVSYFENGKRETAVGDHRVVRLQRWWFASGCLREQRPPTGGEGCICQIVRVLMLS